MLEEFKKAVIREDYVLLTGNYISALILNQFVYWTKRVYDHDKFVKEELVRLKREDQTTSFPLRSGWIYKTATQLNNELMIDVSDATIHKYLNIVLEMGLIEQRNNPNHKWDRTLQYRVNLAKLHVELVKIGSGLEGFKTLTDEIATLTDENAFSEFENGVSESENRTTKNSRALPEINTDIKIKSTKDIAANAAPPPPPMPSTNGNHALNGSSGKDSPPPGSAAPPSQDLDAFVSEMLEAWGRLFPDKPQPRPGTYRSKIKTQLKLPQFRERWLEAMEWAAKSPSCQESWFHFGYFVQQTKGEYGWEKCLRRWMDWKDKKIKANSNGRIDDIDSEWQAIKMAAAQPGRPNISERALIAIQTHVPGGWRTFKEQDARFFDQLKPVFKEAYERANNQQPATA